MENFVELPFSFCYDRSSAPSLQEVVDSLQGINSILKRTPKILTELIGVQVSSVEACVNNLKTGSLYEDLVVKFMMGGEEQMDLFLSDMHNKIMNHKVVPYAVFLALVVCGGVAAYNIFAPENVPISPVVNSYNNTIINVISADVEKDPEQVRSIIEKVIPKVDDIKLAKDSYKILKVFSDSDSLKIKEVPELELKKDVVKSFPENLDLESVEKVRKFEKVEVQIRAADLDSVKRGWAAKVPVLGGVRIRVNVADEVDISSVQIGESLNVDLTVVYKNESGIDIPNFGTICKIY